MTTSHTPRFLLPVPTWNADWQKWQQVFETFATSVDSNLFALLEHTTLIPCTLPTVSITDHVFSQAGAAKFISRTLQVEVSVGPNDLTLIPGALVCAHILSGAVGPQSIEWELRITSTEVDADLVVLGVVGDDYAITWYNGARLGPGTPLALFAFAGGGGGTLDASYDFGGAGAGRSITVDAGSVELTVPDGADAPGLVINQNDVTNNPPGLKVTNASSGWMQPSIELSGNNRIILSVEESGSPDDSYIYVAGLNKSANDAGAFLNAANTGTGDADVGLMAFATSGNALASINATSASGSSEVSLSSGDDINFSANGSVTIPFNVTGADRNLVGFTAGSVIGALNELKAGSGGDVPVTFLETWDQAVGATSTEVGIVDVLVEHGMVYSLKIESIGELTPTGADLELADLALSGSHELLYQIGLDNLGAPRWDPDTHPTWKDRNPFGIEGLTSGQLHWRLSNLGGVAATFRVTLRGMGWVAIPEV